MSLKLFGMCGDVFLRFVLVAPEALGGERGKHSFILLMADGVFATALVFRGAFHSFAFLFVSLNFAAACSHKERDFCRDIFGTYSPESDLPIDAGGKT